jgi:UDP-2,4-diacetamido-2,4,6-trideoxy-beta-L-altropyranose hydrolase
LAWDIAISASGTASWELVFMRLPNLLIILADNQKLTAEALQKKCVSAVLGFDSHVTRDRVGKALAELIPAYDKRLAMSEQGRRLVDGRGAKRVAANLRAPALVLRRARQDDSRLLWEWANDPEVRKFSFSQDPISWETHLQWFSKNLASPNSLMYIAENGDGTPIGQIRYNIKDQEASVSVSLAKAERGRGSGVVMIICGTLRCFADSRVKTIHADIKPENEISIGAFGAAGYSEGAAVQVNGQPARQFVFPRPVTLNFGAKRPKNISSQKKRKIRARPSKGATGRRRYA